jgi:hypothetical protein
MSIGHEHRQRFIVLPVYYHIWFLRREVYDTSSPLTNFDLPMDSMESGADGTLTITPSVGCIHDSITIENTP